MATTQELIFMLDRNTQSNQELKAHAVQLLNLKGEVREAQSTLANLQNQISQAKTLTADIDGIHQELKSKKTELAELNLTIAKKHEQHGSIDSDLRSLIKRASAVTA